MNKIKVIIVEDNIKAQEYLTLILKSNFKDIEIVAYAKSVKQSIDVISNEKPELVFMDIELSDGNAFEIFEKIDNINFEVVFVTAHDDFLKKAIDHYAFSFIIKPIEEEKIISCINRYINLKERLFSTYKLKNLTKFLDTQDSQFLLHVGNEHILVRLNDIVKCVADGNYTQFYFKSKKKYLASNPLKYYEALLVNKGFFRAHRSILVNIDFINTIYRKETIILKNRERINVSTRNKFKLVALIKLLS